MLMRDGASRLPRLGRPRDTSATMTHATHMQQPTTDPSSPYWDERLETLPSERRRLLREHRLHWQVRRCWDGSPFYRARLGAAGIEPSTFGGLADWGRLPILREADLPATVDWALAPQSWWDHQDEAEGRPVRVVTDGDAIQQADLAARALWAAGARPGQPLPVGSSGLSLMARPDIVLGAGRIGAEICDADLSQFAPARSWPFVGQLDFRCRDGEVAHWNEDHFLIELVDQATGRTAEVGAPGVVVITDLAREGSPLLRFWTGQRASALLDEPCRCGRTLAHSRSLGEIRRSSSAAPRPSHSARSSR
jgi:phenylacetate-coenzyme A ligase PaaK-like adenylate-forming protein